MLTTCPENTEIGVADMLESPTLTAVDKTINQGRILNPEKLQRH